jgi:hypothetical protein
MLPSTHTITTHEFARCHRYVIHLQHRSNRHGFNHANARPRNQRQRRFDDVNGHCGEIAFCRCLGIDWTPDINAFHDIPDILNIFEIRTTHYPHGRLIIRDDENQSRCFVLITGNAWQIPRTMTLRGYIWGHKAAQPEFLDNPHNHRPSWFVPQTALSPLTPALCRYACLMDRPKMCEVNNG